MNKTRLEAFSDGVIAIIITIMVLELKVPHGDSWDDLLTLWPVFLSYVLSFANVGIYWNNHHHMLHAVKKINGPILLANLHLLFWLSLVPFTTGWMGENHFTKIPVAVYAFDLLMCGIAYFILQNHMIRIHGKTSTLALAVGADYKGKLSFSTYLVALVLALFDHTVISLVLMFLIGLIWLIPDRRIEKRLQQDSSQ